MNTEFWAKEIVALYFDGYSVKEADSMVKAWMEKYKEAV